MNKKQAKDLTRTYIADFFESHGFKEKKNSSSTLEYICKTKDGFDGFASATGYFGPMTQKALKDWQKKNKLQANGVFGPASRELLAKQSKK